MPRQCGGMGMVHVSQCVWKMWWVGKSNRTMQALRLYV